MATLDRTISLNRQAFDAWLSLWGCRLGGVCLSSLAILSFQHYAASKFELLQGVTISVADCCLLFLLGGLARQVHLAVWRGKAPWHLRRRELLAHGLGLAVLAIGVWKLTSSAFGIVGTLTTGLMFLGIYVTILCAGCWFTLSPSRQNPAESKPFECDEQASRRPRKELV
jgi:hypothetical protein